MKRLTPRSRLSRLLLIAAVAVAAGINALALDLKFHGLAWKVFYDTTGEDSPAKQIYGFVQFLGNFPRRQPVTTASVALVDWSLEGKLKPFGVNTFLEQEA